MTNRFTLGGNQPTKMSSVEQSTAKKSVSRRSTLRGAAVLLGGSTALSLQTQVPPAASEHGNARQLKQAGQPAVSASDKVAIVETVAGKVRGYIREGIFTYKGIPYAEVAAQGRFQPARKPQPWTGVRSSVQYGRVCPQGPRGTWDEDEESWLFCYDDGVQGEDCLRVNIWTPGINDDQKLENNCCNQAFTLKLRVLSSKFTSKRLAGANYPQARDVGAGYKNGNLLPNS